MDKQDFTRLKQEHTEMFEMLEMLVNRHYIESAYPIIAVKRLMYKIKPNYNICLKCFAHHTNLDYEGCCSQTCFDSLRNHKI